MVLQTTIVEMPSRIRNLKWDPVRNVPVPWFVPWIDGKPEFRMAESEKLLDAIRGKLCWVCGDKLGKFMTFVIGPMCGCNRVSAEPPSHLECGRWSCVNCPFLSKPQMHRREDEFMESHEGQVAGFMIKRNPGVTLLWTTTKYELFGDGKGGVLFNIGKPSAVEWWSGGKIATRQQVDLSIETGLPTLRQMCLRPDDHEALDRQIADLQQYLP